jgi:hypothetical protein
MAGQRPLGLKILGGLFVVWGLISSIFGVLYIINRPGNSPQVSVETYRQEFFKRVPRTEENVRKFEQMAPQLEKMAQAVNKRSNDPILKTQKGWNIFCSFVWLMLGIGLLMLKEKARIATIAFQLFSMVVESIFIYVGYDIMLKTVVNAPVADRPNSFLMSLPLIIALFFFVLITFLVIWYLNQPQVKEQFV